jgi:hypothetical protein
VSNYGKEADLYEAKVWRYNMVWELQKGDLAFKQACSHKRACLQKVWLKSNNAQT